MKIDIGSLQLLSSIEDNAKLFTIRYGASPDQQRSDSEHCYSCNIEAIASIGARESLLDRLCEQSLTTLTVNMYLA